MYIGWNSTLNSGHLHSGSKIKAYFLRQILQRLKINSEEGWLPQNEDPLFINSVDYTCTGKRCRLLIQKLRRTLIFDDDTACDYDEVVDCFRNEPLYMVQPDKGGIQAQIYTGSSIGVTYMRGVIIQVAPPPITNQRHSKEKR